MPRNKKVTGKRYNIPSETLERARAELRGEISTPPSSADYAAAKSELDKPTPDAVKAAARSPKKMVMGGSAAIRRVPTAEEFAEHYHYVGPELRRLAIVSIVLFAAIIVAAVAIPR